MESGKDINESKDLKPHKNKKKLTIKITTPAELKYLPVQRKGKIVDRRVTGDQFFIHNYKIIAVKTAILIDQENIPDRLTKANVKSFQHISTHRPIEKIKSLSDIHSPIEVMTPKGSTLTRISKLGSLSIFSNEPDLEPVIHDSSNKIRGTQPKNHLNDNFTYEKSHLFYAKKELAQSEIPIVLEIKKEIKPIATLPERTVIIDTETTGLYADFGDRVVEIGAIEMIDGKPSGKEYRQIINPERDIPKELHEKNIHHITNAVVKDKPLFKDIADDFLHFIDQALLVGHNLTFDLGFLENELKLINSTETLANRYGFDTKSEAIKLSFEKSFKYPAHSLDALCKYYHISLSPRKNGHGALIDAKLTGQLFQKLKEEKESDQYKSIKLN